MNFVVEKHTSSCTGCLTQLYFFCFFVIVEGYILTAMACDHYVAICKPWLCHVILSTCICAVFILGAYVMGCWSFLAHTLCLAKLTFCNANLVNNYLGDILPVLQLFSASTYDKEVVVFVLVGMNIVVSTSTTLICYVSSLPTSFASAPHRAVLKPSTHAVPTWWLSPPFLEWQHSNTCNFRMLNL